MEAGAHLPRHLTHSFLDSLGDDERDALIAAGQTRSWAKGDVLMFAGDRGDSAIVILSGLVKIHKTASASEVVLALCGRGDILGEITAVRDSVRGATVTALEPVAGVVISVRSLRGFLGAHPRAALAFLELALARLATSDRRRMEFATSGSLGRVTSRLVELAERFGVPGPDDGSIEVTLPINQEELASWSASSRESTARALHTLRSLGLIETGRLSLLVRDLDGLRDHAAQP
jgi:CRP-like cAMP-binding protein